MRLNPQPSPKPISPKPPSNTRLTGLRQTALYAFKLKQYLYLRKIMCTFSFLKNQGSSSTQAFISSVTFMNLVKKETDLKVALTTISLLEEHNLKPH